MKKYICILVMAFFSVSLLFANSSAMLYRADDPIVRQVEQLLIQTGYRLPSIASPHSAQQLLLRLETIDEKKLSAYQRTQLDSLTKVLSTGTLKRYTKYVTLNAGLYVEPELYIHTNQSTELTEREWAFNQKARGDFGGLFGEATVGNFYLVYRQALRKLRGWESATQESAYTGTFNTNITFADKKQEHSSPHSAYLGYSNQLVTMAIGRDTLNIGRGSTGNLLLGDHLDYHDFVRFSVYGGVVDYSFSATQFNLIRKDNGTAYGISFYDPFRLYVTHTLEAEFLKKVRVALSESALFLATHLDLRMFSPMMFMHNYYNTSEISDDFTSKGSYNEVNNFFSLNVEWSVTPGLLLYAEIGLDQLQTSSEMQNLSNPPNAYGALMGLRFSKALEKGSLYGFVEGVYTSPYLYLRGNSTLNDSDYQDVGWNISLVGALNNPWNYSGVGFIGYHYGPDTIVAAMQIGYERNDVFNLFADVELSLHGERGLLAQGKNPNLDVMTDYSKFSPSGTIEWRLVSGVGCTVTLLPSLQAYTQLNYLHRWNFRNQLDVTFSDLQLVLGASYHLKLF